MTSPCIRGSAGPLVAGPSSAAVDNPFAHTAVAVAHIVEGTVCYTEEPAENIAHMVEMAENKLFGVTMFRRFAPEDFRTQRRNLHPDYSVVRSLSRR